MTQAAQTTVVSPAEYLAFERASELRHEYIDGQVVAMTGGTFEHAVIAGNIAGELRAALRDRACWVCPADIRTRFSGSLWPPIEGTTDTR